ncbi:SAM-dependent methyltransferase [Streptomyces sp. SID5785]|uniref:SAM-dependent methyltransferase n=1 Tax=Streptomyces sp. SID5785 TaxID=2690309 RepID=UPI001361E76C|nr:SAM-dependent methyltransferase [Streptomyces sp. SID5785]MZD03761.1 SAM-dependent methyltransferase [Streptomyces sp. SID5785]
MTPTLVRRHRPHRAHAPHVDLHARARDWAEIQERMLAPLYEAVFARLEVGRGTRFLGLDCGAGLALVLAAARGASVAGVERAFPERLALAGERLERGGAAARRAQAPGGTTGGGAGPYGLIAACRPIGCTDGDAEDLTALLADTVPQAERGALVVLTGWGPPDRCTTSRVLEAAAGLADPLRGAGGWRAARRDDLEEVAQRAGLRPEGSGRVACPFGYADTGSAVRGLLSTGLFDAAAAATDPGQVTKEVTEALQPYVRADGTVWMPNIFRYLVART